IGAAPVTLVSLAKQPRPAKRQGAMQQGGDGRQSAPGTLNAASAIAQTWRQNAGFGTALGLVDQLAKRLGRNERVVIEEEQMLAARLFRRLIVGTGEALIIAVANEEHFGKITLDHVGSTIAGAVIDDD